MNFFNKSMLASLIPMVEGQLPEIERKVIDHIRSYPKKTGEAEISVIISIDDNHLELAVVAFDADNRPVRLIDRKPLVDFIRSLIQNT